MVDFETQEMVHWFKTGDILNSPELVVRPPKFSEKGSYRLSLAAMPKGIIRSGLAATSIELIFSDKIEIYNAGSTPTFVARTMQEVLDKTLVLDKPTMSNHRIIKLENKENSTPEKGTYVIRWRICEKAVTSGAK